MPGAPARLLAALEAIVGPDACLSLPEHLLAYECDGLTLHRGCPAAVVLPRDKTEVSRVVRACRAEGASFVPRGAGTGLSGGALAPEGSVVVECSRLNRIVEIDPDDRVAVVQPGVVNGDLSKAAARFGLHFAPDPSSQLACTIGGNVAESSGGPHTLAYGVTVNHVTVLTVVMPSGEILRFGGKAAECTGYDLTGFLVGSEGTIGIVTEITVRLLRRPEHIATLLGIFETIDDGAKTVSAITAAGITPAALEMLDGWTLRAVEAACHAGYPLDAGAVLLIELEGLAEQVEEQAEAVREVCFQQKAREVRRAKDENERGLLWKGRKNAFAALGRLAPSYYSQDGVVPRTKIPAVLQFIEGISQKYGLRIGNIFHAGDGNLHPLILFDPRDPHQLELVQAAGAEILERCVEMGGSITGEHGVGLEKRNLMPLLFTDDDLDVMLSLHNAFNAAAVLNPGKLFPTTRMCRETSGPSTNPVLQAEGM